VIHVAKEGDEPTRMGRDDATTRVWWRKLVFTVLDVVGFEGDREGCARAFSDAFSSADAWRVFPDVVPALDALRTSGIGMGVISNWDYRLPSLLELTGLRAYFDPVLVSVHEGLAKPDPRLFARALARIGLHADEVLYVGDHLDLDIEPAQSVGIRAFLIDRRGSQHGDHVITDLGELLRYI
jgi:putative hydrolase of the HAD superfamily